MSDPHDALDREEAAEGSARGHQRDAQLARMDAHKARAEAEQQRQRADRAERRVRKLERLGMAAMRAPGHWSGGTCPSNATPKARDPKCAMCRLLITLETK